MFDKKVTKKLIFSVRLKFHVFPLWKCQFTITSELNPWAPTEKKFHEHRIGTDLSQRLKEFVERRMVQIRPIKKLVVHIYTSQCWRVKITKKRLKVALKIWTKILFVLLRRENIVV